MPEPVIRSFEQINPDQRDELVDRMILAAEEYKRDDSSRAERRKLSPLLGKILTEGPAQIVEYLTPRKPYEYRKHPDWTGVEITKVDDKTIPTGIVTVRDNAELILRGDEVVTSLNCVVVGALSFRDDQVAFGGLLQSGIEVAGYKSSLPIVGVEKSSADRGNNSRRIRAKNLLIGHKTEPTMEELAMRDLMGEPVFTGNIIRDDMNGLFAGAEHGVVFSTTPIPELTNTTGL